MFCPKCGHPNQDGVRFCSGCGLTLAAGASAAGMSTLERPGVITLLAALNFVVGALLIVGTIVVAFAIKGGDDVPAAAPFIIVGVGVLFGALKIAGGLGLWKLKPWGRWIQIAFSILGLINFPVGTVISGLILYYLFRPGIKVLFSGKSARALAPAEAQAVRDLGQTSAVGVVAAVAVVVLVMVAVIGIIAAIAIPNLLNAIQRGKQKRTITDLRAIGVAIESYQVDQGFFPRVPSGPDAAQALAAHLQPTYIKALPAMDAWKHPFAWEYSETIDEDGAVVGAYSIISFGKDRRPDAEVTGGATTRFNSDIYFSDGQFSQYPEGVQQ